MGAAQRPLTCFNDSVKAISRVHSPGDSDRLGRCWLAPTVPAGVSIHGRPVGPGCYVRGNQTGALPRLDHCPIRQVVIPQECEIEII